MNALRRAWEHEHGRGSVVGLAPSAVAAHVLADDLGIAAENTAKWLDTHDRTGATFRRGQLVIVDEASMAGTLALDRITALATAAGAKTLVVGDYAQLQLPTAAGAYAMLVHDRDDAPELTAVHRLAHAWEKTASSACATATPASSTPTRTTAASPKATARRWSKSPTGRGAPTRWPGGRRCSWPTPTKPCSPSTGEPAPS